ncbi:MAG: RidA family protein [Alphaproteobacteria bacterium]|jgi:2-iminobutanoate/2-iminopropanoate deaminase
MTWDRDAIVPANEKLNVSKNFNLPHSPGVKAGPLIYLSGMISIDPDTGSLALGTVESETRQIFANMAHLLESNGSGLDRVVKVNAFIHDMLEAETFNRVFREAFPAEPPARTVCGVRLSLGAKIEIEAIALAGNPAARTR